MKNLKINGLWVKDSDNGKIPLVFVHAFPLSSEMWENQVTTFRSDYRVIAYDVRGLGNSSQNNNQFMMESYADDLIDLINYLKLEKVNAAGLSMGGYIIQRALLKNPDLFKTIILADTRLERDSNEGLSSRATAIQKIKTGKRQEFLNIFIKNLVSNENFKNKDYGFPARLYALQARVNLEYRLNDRLGVFVTGGYGGSRYYNKGVTYDKGVIVEGGVVLFKY